MYGEFDIYIIQVEEAEAVLYQIKQLYKTGHMDSDKMSTLTDDFYQALPHRKKYQKKKFSLKEISGKQDLCQVCCDINEEMLEAGQ
jgi:hypothetical protein